MFEELKKETLKKNAAMKDKMGFMLFKIFQKNKVIGWSIWEIAEKNFKIKVGTKK